jgi:hypothetical protein
MKKAQGPRADVEERETMRYLATDATAQKLPYQGKPL